MRFFADRSEGHGTSRETLDDFFRRFNLFYGHRLARLLDFHQATQRGQVAALSIDQCGIFFKALKVLLADTVLQFADRVGIQQVIFAVYPEVIAAAYRELSVGVRNGAEGEFVLKLRFARQNVQSNSADPGSGSGEIRLDQIFIKSDGFEDLRAAITLQRRDAHLRKGFKQSFVDRLDEVLDRDIGSHAARQITSSRQIFESFDCKIRIDSARAIADQQREMHDLTRLAGFDD